ASSRTAQALEQLDRSGLSFDSVLLKYDSLVRGPIAEQLRTAAGFAPVLFCPAVPALGRTMCGGTVHVDGVPLHETAVWDAEQRPAPKSVKELFLERPGDLPSHVAPGGMSDDGGDVVEVSLEQVRSSKFSALLRQHARPGRIVLCDGLSDTDLDRLVQVGQENGYLFAGASGLAGALTRGTHVHAAAAAHPLGEGAGTLMVLGTASAAARDQAAHLDGLGVDVQSWRPGEDLRIDGSGPYVITVDARFDPTASPAIMR